MSETETPKEILPVGQPAPTLPPEPDKVPEDPIDPVLIERLSSLKAIVLIDKILQNCTIPGGMAGDLLVSQEFLKKMHAPLMKECQSHKDFERATNQKPPKTPEEIEAEKVVVEKAVAKRNRKAKRKGMN